jgi:hypothetical protein
VTKVRNKPFATWAEVSAFALSLPDTESSTSYGKPAVKLNGKAFLFPSREADSFGVMSPLDEKELLMETEPDTFWETPHYSGYPAVLIRYGSASRERIELVVQRAWWDRAKKPQRTAFGPRP